MSNKKLLIIGGEGFIGSNIANKAVLKKYDVTVIKFQQASKNNKQAYDAFSCDIRDKKKLSLFLKDKQFNYVINCSGHIEHTQFQEGGRELIEQHFTGLMNIIEFIDRNKLEAFVQLGSSDEYGANQAPQFEDQRELAISPYSFGKAAATHFLQMLNRQEKSPAIIFRLFLVYGPGQSFNRFVPQIIDACIKNKVFPVSEAEQLRDFCYLDDIADAVLASLDNRELYGEVINLASGQAISIKSMIEKIQNLSGGGQPEFGKVSYRPGENMCLYANIDKAKRLMGWSPSVALDDGLAKTIEYYKTLN